MDKDRSKLFRDPRGEIRWKRTAPNGERVGMSSEGYKAKADAITNYERTNGPDAPFLEDLDPRE